MVVVHGKLGFVVESLNAWYTEHLRSYELEKTKTIKILEPSQLSDLFPLAAYTVAGKRMVTEALHLPALDALVSTFLSDLC